MNPTKKVMKKVSQTIHEYKLCTKNEKVLLALSGGKDSSVMAYVLKKLGYNIEGIYINLYIGKYSEDCLKAVEDLCSMLKIKLHVYDLKKEVGTSMCYIRQSVQSKQKLSNCAICGVFKKWILNKKARELGAGKIATGHHRNDEIETFMLNILKGSPKLNQNFGPILKVKDKKFVPRIKPLFFISEDDIREMSKKLKLPVVYSVCPCRGESYRVEVKEFLKEFSDREKEKMMDNLIEISKKIKKEQGKVIYCEKCGEPSRGKLCKRCEMMNLVKDGQENDGSY